MSVYRRVVIALVAIIGAVSCSDSSAPADVIASEALRNGLFVSGMSQIVEPADSLVSGGAGAASQVALVSYISLAPGTIEDGTTATITNLDAAASVVTTIIDGGFDPKPLAASPGDTLEVVVARIAGQSLSAVVVVEAESEPRIVRTNPPRGQSDVPVNTNVTIVFSEPVLASTVTASSITLTQGAAVVSAIVGVQPAAAYAVDIVPLAPLAPNATYTISIQASVTNLGGNPISAPVAVQFVTSQESVAPLVFSFVGVGSHTCALTAAGKAYCWGRNTWGNVGDGTTIDRLYPVPVAGELTFASLDVSYRRTCGLTTSGAAYCWGTNEYGSLGDGTVVDRPVPTRAAPALTFTSISTNSGVTCGVTLPGDAYCWGIPTFGMLGGATDACPAEGCTTPIKVAGDLTFAAVDVGAYTTCGRTTAGAGYCWGANYLGELGTGTNVGPETCTKYGGYFDPAGGVPCSRTPVAITGSLTLSAIGAGGFFNCGLDGGGAAFCWGGNNQGQFGNGTTTGVNPNATPTSSATDLAFRVLSAGNQRVCGVTTTNVAYCWGGNYQGEAGGPGCSVGCSLATPRPVDGGFEFVTVAANSGHACALTPEGRAYCWGNNTYGSFGNGSTLSSYVPVAVKRQ
jgi:alpha-tubulin suppressor-like RCC1 family protein